MKSIDELQYEYLTKLLLCNKSLTISQAIYRMSLLNQAEAKRRIQCKNL